MGHKSLSLQGFGMGFDYATLGFSSCITPEPCLSVNDGQNRTGQYELDEAIDNDDKVDILAVLYEFFDRSSISSSCPYLCVANFVCPLPICTCTISCRDKRQTSASPKHIENSYRVSSRLATVLANGRMLSWAAFISAGIAVMSVLYTQRIMSWSKC